MPDSQTAQQVMGFLKSEIARFTKTVPESIADDAVLIDLGLQSIDAVIMSGNVEDTFNIELDPATVFEHETLASFAAEITARITG